MDTTKRGSGNMKTNLQLNKFYYTLGKPFDL